MADNCSCQFCVDYARFKVVLPLIPEEHRAWFESMCDARWHAEEELSYKKAILDGSWPSAIEQLGYYLSSAIEKKKEREKNGL